jgi:hypothetical protein
MIPAVATAALAYRLRGDQQSFDLWRARVLEVEGITDPSQDPEAHAAAVTGWDASAHPSNAPTRCCCSPPAPAKATPT